MTATISPNDIRLLLHAEHQDPFAVLGLHQTEAGWVVRSFRPDARELTVLDRHDQTRRFQALKIAEEGLFEASLEGVSSPIDYLLNLSPGRGKPSKSVIRFHSGRSLAISTCTSIARVIITKSTVSSVRI